MYRALLLGLLACGNPLDGTPHDGLVGIIEQRFGGPDVEATALPDLTVKVYTTTGLLASTQSDADGNYHFDVTPGAYVLCVGVDDCPSDGSGSRCCTSATAPVDYAEYDWQSNDSGGEWYETLP